MTLTANEVYIVNWTKERPAPTSLAQKAKRLEQVAWDRLQEFLDSVDRGEYGIDSDGAAYCEERDRVNHDFHIANERYEIIRSGETCDCAEGGCRICNAYFYVTNAQEDK